MFPVDTLFNRVRGMLLNAFTEIVQIKLGSFREFKMPFIQFDLYSCELKLYVVGK